MNKITKRGWIELGASLGIFIVLAVIAAFYDLKINQALYNPDSLFGQYFANLGELPSYLAAPLCGTIFFYQGFGRTKAQRILFCVACAGIVFVGYFFAIGHWFWDNFVNESLQYKLVYILVFTLFMTALTLFAGYKIDKKVMRKLLWFALFAAVVIALSNIIVQIMKIIWARQRFRTMVDIEKNAALIAEFGGDFRGFTPWYIPNAIIKNPIRTDAYVAAHKLVDSDTFKSFPSGHTVAAAASFAAIILPDMYPKFKKATWAFWVVPAVYTTLVAISRIVMGAHYLSDVLFGGFIGFGVAALIRWIFLSKIKYFQQQPTEEPKIIVLSE